MRRNREKKSRGLHILLTSVLCLFSLMFGFRVASQDGWPGQQENRKDVTCEEAVQAYLQLDAAQTPKEKLALLQTIADYEAKKLGCSVRPKVRLEKLDDSINAAFQPEKGKQIVVQKKTVMKRTADELLETICHECRHLGQWETVEALSQIKEDLQDLYYLEEAVQMKTEFENYVSGLNESAESRDAYRSQHVETDASGYGELRLWKYQSMVAEGWREGEA